MILLHRTMPLAALAALAAHVAAQSQVPVPAVADLVDGHDSVGLPFGVPGFRTQILIDGDAIAPNGAVIQALRFRCDRNSIPAGPVSVPNVTVAISQSTAPVGGMDTTFANNITGTETVVFQGTVNLPAHVDAGAGPLPWDIEVVFAQPFVFTNGQGNVLIDILGNNPVGGFPTYYLDANVPGGSKTSLGTSGIPSGFDNLNMVVGTGFTLETRLLSPGHTIDFSATTSFTQPLALMMLGFGAPATPVDLTPLGAPGNFLYVNPDVTAGLAWQQSFIGYYSTIPIDVPASPQYLGALLYGQFVTLDPPANPLGLVFSNAVEVRIGDEFEVFPMQQLDAADPAAASGELLVRGFFGNEWSAVPVQLDGVFF